MTFRFTPGDFMKFPPLLRLLSVLGLFAGPAAAQSPTDAVDVFLDCNRCDQDFIRTEITFVNWVRDRTVADVHILVAGENTGGGGERYTLTFVGLRRFASREDTLVFTTNRDDSNDQERRALTRALTAGLVPFVASTPTGLEKLQIKWIASQDSARAAPMRPHDPWKAWVFTLRLNSFFNGEESQQFLNWNTEVEARRTTEQQKAQLELNSSFNRSSFSVTESDGTERDIVSTQEFHNAEALVVQSIGRHWAIGGNSEAVKATFANIDFAVLGGPAVEYSIWPYAEATRRALVFRYSLAVHRHSYDQRTIYGKLAETLPSHSLTGELRMQQRWGSVRFQSRFAQYLHDTRFNNLSTFGRAEMRLFKGFSVNFHGSYSRVRDQLSLPEAELTPEEVLLRQKELSTGYRYFGGVGVSYSFGSIFNNVVNPRFSGS